MTKKLLLLIPFLLGTTIMTYGQGSSIYGPGLKLSANPEGSKYVRFIVWNQVWAKYNQNNPGTLVNGTAQDNSFDIGARRTRALIYAQVSPRFLILTHFGINNQTFVNGGTPNGGVTGNGGTYTSGKKPGLFIHDAWNEYAVIMTKKADGTARKGSLSIGSGLHYWNGLSRMTNASTLNFLCIDAPIFNWPTIEIDDQFARMYGIYAKGKLGKLDYRMSVNQPFATNSVSGRNASNAQILNVALNNNSSNTQQYSGYFNYQFFDQESNLLPYMVGTYVGTKKVFNIGAGFISQKEGTVSYQASGTDTVLTKHDINLFAADVFADLPFGGEKNMAFTGYSSFSVNDWGPNYYRNVGIMNVGTNDPSFTGTKSQAGAGNARPLTGTGSIWYTQAGLLLPKGFITDKARIQPFVSYTMKNLDALNESINFFDAGLNYYIEGHHAKISVQYSNRPLIVAGAASGGKGEFILQTQIFL